MKDEKLVLRGKKVEVRTGKYMFMCYEDIVSSLSLGAEDAQEFLSFLCMTDGLSSVFDMDMPSGILLEISKIQDFFNDNEQSNINAIFESIWGLIYPFCLSQDIQILHLDTGYITY